MNIFDRDYKNWIKDISSRFRRSQIKAATHVNEDNKSSLYGLVL